MSPMGSQQNQPNPQSQPPGQNPGQPNQSSLVNLLHSNSTDQQSPYQNQAKSPASQMNGNIMSPTPSQVIYKLFCNFTIFIILATRWSTIDSAISTRICANNAIWTSTTFTCTYKSNDTSKSCGSKYSWWTK